MRLLFCADPLNRRLPDSMYDAEVEAAKDLALPYELLDFEALTYEMNADKAVRRVTPSQTPELAVYRGWMLPLVRYKELFEALAERGISLVNSPDAYRHCHYLPDSYPMIAGKTPETVWTILMGEPDFDAIMLLLTRFGDKPLILKDWVKSQKHHWEEACFIPCASDRKGVQKVVEKFLELQGTDLNVGLVFREFIEFEALVQHEKSGMPLTEEWRLFCADGEVIAAATYWENCDYADSEAPIEEFLPTIQRVKSRFFTMDIARKTNGDALIIELGDAQVAGLPGSLDVARFYRRMSEKWLQTNPTDAAQ